MSDLGGRVAAVIGGARGIGQAYCEALLEKGVKVVCGDILETDGINLVRELGKKYGKDYIIFKLCSATNDKQIDDLLSVAKHTFGSLDIVVNNAGCINEFNWQKCMDLNVGGVFRTTIAAFRYMSKDKGGKGGDIIHTASKSGLRPEFWGPVYSSSKHAVIGYVRSWGMTENYRLTGVRVNCVCPTSVKTQFAAENVKPERTQHSDAQMAGLANLELISPSFVADGLIKILEDPEANGKALVVSQAEGLKYHEFTEPPDH